MLAARAVKPKLSLNIAPATAATQTTRPALSLKSPLTPLAPLKSPLGAPLSPLPSSPTAMNTKLNQRGFSTIAQQPTYTYVNNSSSRSILKRSSTGTTRTRQLHFSEDPIVFCVSPIEEPDYYGGYRKMTKDERRWMIRS